MEKNLVVVITDLLIYLTGALLHIQKNKQTKKNIVNLTFLFLSLRWDWVTKTEYWN